MDRNKKLIILSWIHNNSSNYVATLHSKAYNFRYYSLAESIAQHNKYFGENLNHRTKTIQQILLIYNQPTEVFEEKI